MEQLVWLAADTDLIEVHQLPTAIRSGPALVAMSERRRQLADELYEAIVTGGYSFWEHIHPLFLSRDLTRHDIRELMRRGLNASRGNYRSLLQLFRIPRSDYKRFMNFLATHDCRIDFREFRNHRREANAFPRVALPKLPPLKAQTEEEP